VSAWDPTSGVLTVYRSIARHLTTRGVRFSAFAFDGWTDDTRWTFCDELVDGRSTTLAQVLMSGSYDVLHCIDGAYAPPYGVETWIRRARYRGAVVLMSQIAKRQLNGPVHATTYVACSSDAAAILERDADGPVEVIANGYDEEVFTPGRATDGGRPLLVWVGRSFDPQKDVDLFLEMAESLPTHDAVLIDADPDATALKARLSPRVRHRALLDPGEVADVYRAAAASGGAFVSTSRWEGFPFAAVEAMACGCPVVAPRIPGHGHLVDEVHAIIYDRAAGASGAIDALRRLDDGALRAELVRRARHEAATRWTSRAMADAYGELYQRALLDAARTPGETLRDRIARAVWRAALEVRPAWHRLRRVTHD
jgi:glycosyltransferase involved in cell wall biosynthesis